MSAGPADPNAVYPLGRSPGESERLGRQSDDLAGDSAALLDRIGLGPGQAAIDLGCGPRGILDLLAERVAPGGRVVGVDANPAHVAMAAEFAARRGPARGGDHNRGRPPYGARVWLVRSGPCPHAAD